MSRNIEDRKIKDRLDYYSRKIKAVEYCGGECKECGERNQSILTFHHLMDKDKQISLMLRSSWERIKKELDKCELLCLNCHYEKHFINKEPKNKRFILEIKGVDSCEQCGYNKNIASLNFHHPNDDKKYEICNVHVKINNPLLLKEKLEDELNKCIVLCSNCHKLVHTDIEFLEKYKYEIENKTWLKYKPKIDKMDVLDLYNKGYRQTDIIKHFNSCKGTIGSIFKELRNRNLIE